MEPNKAILYVEHAPEFSESGNVFRATFVSGGLVFAAACSPHTLLGAIHNAQKAYDDWAADNRSAQGIRATKKR